MPTYRLRGPEPVMCIMAALGYANGHGYEVGNPHWLTSGVIHWSRNKAIKEAGDKYDWLLFVDDDMIPEKDALFRLLQHDQPIISALTTSRELPPRLNVKAYSHEEDRFVFIERVKPDTLIRGDIGVGAGFLLLRRDAVDAAIKNHLEARDWLDEMTPMFDRMGIAQEKRDAERRYRSDVRMARAKAGEVMPQVFDFITMDNGLSLGEDICFCRRMLRAGWKIAVDTGVQVGHSGDFGYGPWNLQDKSSKDMSFLNLK